MSGRSGYRKTDRKRAAVQTPPETPVLVLRFVLPPMLAFAIAPGGHGWGVTVGDGDVVFVFGRHARQCSQLAADFLFSVGAGDVPIVIPAALLKLLPCRVYSPRGMDVFGPMTADLQAIHGTIEMAMRRARKCSISISTTVIVIRGAARIPLQFRAP